MFLLLGDVISLQPYEFQGRWHSMTFPLSEQVAEKVEIKFFLLDFCSKQSFLFNTFELIWCFFNIGFSPK